jgi:RHS repeat-associated protein
VNGSTVTTYARDGQKSIRAELNGSSVNASFRYRAYGEIAQYSGSATPSLLGYAGQLLEPSGLYYMRARWYDAASARFLSRDPLTEIAALASAFCYAADPLRMSDPTGLSPADENDKPVPSWRNWEREVGSRLASEYPGSDYELQYNRAIRDVDGEVMRDSRGVVRRPDYQVFRGGRLVRVVEAAEGTPDYLLGTRKTQQIEGLRDIAGRQGENPEVTVEFRVSTSPVFRLAGRAAGPISIIILYLQTRDQFRQIFEPPAPRTIAG